ncbi:MFS transporter [Georgenia phoenicis]|uniref:MFS transporter n=1 Tax=unclassified Georgenia TaxID=2626815 RepID=UPI0039AFA20A
MLYYSFPVALPRITATTGWSATSVMLAISVSLIVAAAGGVPVGLCIDRRGPRPVMTAGSVAAVLGVVGAAASPSLGWFIAALAVVGAAQSLTLYAPAFTAITRWYGADRVRALLALTLVGGLASTVFAPVTAALVERAGWRGAYLVLALVLGVITIPAHALGLRAPWPQDSAAARATGSEGWRTIARSRPFIALTVATSLTAFAVSAATIHLVPMLTWRGLTTTAAAWALGLSGAGQLLGRIGYAPLAARTGPVSRASFILTALAASILLVGLLPGPAPALIGAAIALGVARGAHTLLQSTAVSDRWGLDGFGTLYGILNVPTTLAMALAPWVTAAMAEATGSYPATYVLLAVAGVAAALVVRASGPRPLIGQHGPPVRRR